MPNFASTQSSSASNTTGTPIPLTYGYAWATGKRHAYYTLQNTGDSVNENTRLGIWLLGHGEWDGCNELWINDKLTWNGGTAPPKKLIRSWGFNWLGALDYPEGIVFNFHSGCDSVIGSGLTTPSSVGPDQGLDVLWPLFPPAIQPLDFSRIAYYGLMRKQPTLTQTSNDGNNASQWTDIAPIGLWRALRCRLFDDEGNMSGYAFTTNPAWHFVDVILRRKLMPDYGLDVSAGPDELTTAVRNRFDWGSIFAAAQYYDEFLANGRRRFEGNYSFAQQTSLQAVLEQILLCCRSYSTEYAGKIALNCDMPRSSVFTFSRAHILPGSWNADDQQLHKSANRYIANHRDLLVPECSSIVSITCAYGANPEVTTLEPHPFQAADQIAIGGTDTVYDGNWAVATVPAIINPGASNEVDPTTLTLQSKGTSYPPSVGAGGGIGLLYSRFKERAPEFWHKANMLARGAVGVGIPRLRNKVKQALDFATSTWDQASRLTCYERDRLLGIDQTPYVTPPLVKLRTSLFARDAFGNLACAVRPGDHVTLDSTTNFQYAGEYEVLEPLTVIPPTAKASGFGGAIALRPSENSGEIEFVLGPYNEAVMYDSSDPTQAGWPSVPGSDPGNSVNFTSIPLADGIFSFFTGAALSGEFFQLPSTGFPAANTFSWAGPASYQAGTISITSPIGGVVGGTTSSAFIWSGAMGTIQLCAVGSGFSLTLKYEDTDESTWIGGLNYACLAWLSADTPTTSGGLSWIELTLAGGEKIVFGQGILADGASFTLPAGYVSSQMFAVAFPHDGTLDGTNDAHWMGAFVDGELTVHLNYKDGENHLWHGNAAVLVFAYKNNMSTWTTEALTGSNWAQCTLTGGLVFGVGCALNQADGATLLIPGAAGDGSNLEAIVGPSFESLAATDPSTLPGCDHHAHGIAECYLDAANVVHIQFGDSQGNTWPGTADVFALYCSPLGAIAVVVAVTPASVSLQAGLTFQFAATVLNNANQNVTWSVDGIAGGNLTVGTVDATGNYCAPNGAGSHEVTAASVAAPTSSASAAVTIWGDVLLPPGESILTDAAGNTIYDAGGNVIYVEES